MTCHIGLLVCEVSICWVVYAWFCLTFKGCFFRQAKTSLLMTIQEGIDWFNDCHDPLWLFWFPLKSSHQKLPFHAWLCFRLLFCIAKWSLWVFVFGISRKSNESNDTCPCSAARRTWAKALIRWRSRRSRDGRCFWKAAKPEVDTPQPLQPLQLLKHLKRFKTPWNRPLICSHANWCHNTILPTD